ncbi:YIP1 family protein [Bacillus haynesii]|uniref:YIP1 family protein n=1 Tax=Bacillus haynesii TaxID=1925021 RepID=UPI0022807BE3|nr:YIP1 family protein [Bacillus haynesii]MCY8140787.1 YIP1 family protein [Bacillus haynesii]MEC1454039.1 YIP1 family protein [Bacillus haynesii]MEC1575219.1 YIP1 family protein [Bacillus haynesii]
MEESMETKQEPMPSLIGLISSPALQFERMKKQPAVALPMFAVFFLSVVSAILYISKIYPDSYFGMIIFLWEFLKTGICLFVAALILWLIATIGGGKTNFVTMFSLASFVGFVKIIGDLINNAVFRFANVKEGTSFTSLHDVFSVGEPYKSIWGVFDIFTLWALVLAAVGLQKAGGASKRASWIAVTVLFILKFLFAWFFGLFAALFEGIF